MLSCKDVCNNITDHLEGPTTLGQRLGLRFHLILCRECRRFVHQFQLVIGVARHGQQPDAPTDEEIDSLIEKLATQAARSTAFTPPKQNGPG